MISTIDCLVIYQSSNLRVGIKYFIENSVSKANKLNVSEMLMFEVVPNFGVLK